MPDWLRWVLMLPAALTAYLAIQVGVGLASETLPYPDSVQDWLSQFLNSLLGPWAFVYTGAKLAPHGRALRAAVGLAVLFGVFTGAIGVMVLAIRPATHPMWWIAGTSVISLGMVVATCIQVAREERTGRPAGPTPHDLT